MVTPCKVKGCGNLKSHKGLCPKHYARLRRKGTLVINKSETMTIEFSPCSVAACDGHAFTAGMCRTHYRRWNSYGDVEATSNPNARPKPTTDELFWSRVDKTDDCWLWTGHTGENGAGKFRFDGTVRSAHRYSYMREHNVKLSKGELLRHTCGVGICVRPDHLRRASEPKENSLP